MGNIPNTNTPNLVLQSVGNGSNDSRWGTSGGGSGITQLTSDVTAGPGSGSQIATLTGINGKAIPSSTASAGGEILYYNQTSNTWLYGGLQPGSTAPTVNQVLTWKSATGWTAVTPTGGSGIANNDAGNLYLSTAQSQAPSSQRYPVDGSAVSYTHLTLPTNREV